MSECSPAELFDHNILAFMRDAVRVTARSPRVALFALRTLMRQRRAARLRRRWMARDVHVPPVMIASVTHRCNLHCKGCYSAAENRSTVGEMTSDRLRAVIMEAADMGISIILLAGGEPLTRPEVLDITREFPDVLFPLFTNGTLLTETMARQLRSQPHVVPVISIEGHSADTDARRGAGVSTHVSAAMARLREAGAFFGVSITVTSTNLQMVTSQEFARECISQGCRLFFFVDHVPMQPGTDSLALDAAGRRTESERIAELRRRLTGLFVAFPGDEDQYGGCLAAGRGFVHVSADGWVEPCPFSPYSDSSLKTMSLAEALQSPLLSTIRDTGEGLEETAGGCVLWRKREWVAGLAATVATVPSDAGMRAAGGA